MKKLNIVLMSILTIVLTSILVGCNFKKVEAKFTQSVVSVSVKGEEPLSLDNLLSVQNIGKDKITYHADKNDIVEIVDRSVVGKSSGVSKVYATYNKNYIASMDVIVMKEFSAPTDFATREQNGNVVLSWAGVSDSFGTEIVSATQYNVKIEKTVAGSEAEKEEVLNTVVSQPEVELESENGKGLIYDVTVSAVGDGVYFDMNHSAEVTETVYVGFMPEIEGSSLLWNDGVLSWEGVEIENARYQVAIDGELLDDLQETKTKNLKSYFDARDPGKYEVSVLVYDKTEGEEAKYTRESQKITITKLDVPQLEKEDGALRIVSSDDVENYVLRLTSPTKEKEVVFENASKTDIVTTLSAIEVGEELSGIFTMTLEAKSSGLYYHNTNTNLGKIYKIGKVNLEAVGAASETSWNVKVAINQNLVDSNIVITDGDCQPHTHLLRSGTNEEQVTLDLTVSTSQTTSHTFSAVATSESTTANGETVFVIKSDKSNEVTVTDLSDFQPLTNGQIISHRYDEEDGNSILSFKAITGATKYELYINDNQISNFTTSGTDLIDMKLDCRLESLSAVEKQYKIKLIAKTDDDTTAINTTSPEKTITLLDEVVENTRDDNKNTVYTWQEVANADGYKLEIYKIGYEDFRIETKEFKDITDGQRFEVVQKLDTKDNQFDFTALGDYVGYYYIRVYPTVEDVENFVVSGNCLHDKIAVAVQIQLTLDNVDFGVDQGRYFLKIDKLDHVHQFELTVNEVSQGPIDNNSLEEKNNRYDLPQDFSTSVSSPATITLIATASEENKLLYEDSQEISLSIKQIRDAKFSTTGESDISFDNKTEKLYVEPQGVEGLTSFFVKAGLSNSATMLPGQKAELNIPRTAPSSNVKVEVSYYGSQFDNMTKLYTKSAQGEVVLESVTNFTLSRTESPTDLKYYDGEVTFVDSTNGDSVNGFFVLRVNGPTHNEGQNLEIDVEFRTTAVVYLNGNKVETEISSADYLKSEQSNQKIIKFSEIIELLKAINPEIETTYLQLQEITFNVFVYLLRDDGEGAIKISSPDAKLPDNSTNGLKVNKMPKPELSIDLESADAYSTEVSNFVLNWTDVETDNETSFVLKYGEESKEIKSSTTYSITKSDLTPQTFIEISVEAKNPNYLNSDKSDVITVYVLRGIESVKLTNKATLICDLFDKDVGNFAKIVGKHDGNDLTVEEKIATIDGTGKYSFGLEGELGEDGVYYLGSKMNTWTVEDMKTKAPADTNIKEIVDSKISWDAFEIGANSGLEYVLIFMDENGKTFALSFKETTVDAFKDLAETLIGFEGTLKMQLLAHIATDGELRPTYAFGSTIYYSDKQTLLNQSEEYNYYIYKQDTNNDFMTIEKLKLPEISAVEFEHTSKDNYSDAQSANMKVTFKGNYGAEAKFKVTLAGNEVSEASTISGGNQAEGIYEYSFTLDAHRYLDMIDDRAELTIQAISDKADKIPSVTLKTEILRAGKVVGLSFADDEGNLTHKLKITLPITEETADGSPVRDNRANGGVVVKIEYDVEGASTKYRLEKGATDLNDWSDIDFSDFFKNDMKKGGTFTVSAFIKYNDETRYILPSKETFTAEFKILNPIQSDDTIDDQTPNGFKLVDATSLNSDRTVYVVEYDDPQENGETIVVNQKLSSANNYTFIAPDTFEKRTNLRIYATEEGCLPSIKYEYTLTLNRIKEITAVSMKRNLHTHTFSWLAVDGAKAYEMNFYRINGDKTRGEAIYETKQIEKTEVTAEELFGDNYEKFMEYGKVRKDELLEGFEFIVTIVVVPSESGVHNSLEYEFKMNIIKPDFDKEDLYVDGRGVINFRTQSEKENLFTLDYVALKPEIEEGESISVDPYGWKKITKTKLDTQAIDSNVTKFKVVISTVGSEETEQPVTYDENNAFQLASMGVESDTFYYTDNIKSIDLSGLDPKNMLFSFEGAEETYTIYAGLTNKEIFNEDGNVVEIEIGKSELESEKNSFSYTLSTLVTKLSQIQPLKGETTIYFWAYAKEQPQGEETAEKSVVAKVYDKFALTFSTSVNGEIVKFGTKVKKGDGSVKDDFINTFAVFADDDAGAKTTLGFNVRITGEDGTEYITFITAENARIGTYFDERESSAEAKLAINLTQIFEQLEDESRESGLVLIGNFKIEISKLMQEKTSEKTNITFADWYIAKQENGSDFAFTRLTGAKENSVTLNQGNLRWSGSGDATQFYKVYFINELTSGTSFKNYETFTPKTTYFNASNYAGTNGHYYLAVQGVSENAFLISSPRAFVTNETGSPVEVVKNQITNKIKLQGGTLSIDWTGSDFFVALKESIGDSTWADFAETLTTKVFKVPFTFTMMDIINKTAIMSFEFKPEVGQSITRNFDASILLANLTEAEEWTEVKAKIDEIISKEEVLESTRQTFNDFVLAIEMGKHGIASGRNIFDDEFEKVQTGVYSLSYCLLGGKQSLSSGWYSFENDVEGLNEESKNKLYVNKWPLVSAVKVDHETDKSQSSFKVVFSKSDIYGKTGSTIGEVQAEKYKVRLGEYIFDIIGEEGAYSMVMVDAPKGFDIPHLDTNISVYETNASGELNSGATHLMFYLNLNEGNSVLGKYRLDTDKYEMQIFAVGNDVSVSSKSEKFTVNFLSFDESIRITDGTFVWQPTEGRSTKVIYKKAGDRNGEADIDVGSEETSVYSTFALENAGVGLYEYIKFVVKGEVDLSRNLITVDSSVYRIDNVLKLRSPSLSTQFGLLAFDASKNLDPDRGVDVLDCYTSKENMFNFVVYNDKSYDEKTGITMQKTIVDDRDPSLRGKLQTYEVGITGMTEPEKVDPNIPYTDYQYKATEEKAEKFFMYMLGSDSEFTYQPKEGKDYYITTINFGAGSGKTAIAVRSDVGEGDDNTFGHIDASMLENVTNVHVENGELVWSPVTSRGYREEEGVEYTPAEGSEIVYRVVVDMYAKSNADDSRTSIGENFVYYTTDTKFSFDNVEKTPIIEQYRNEGRELFTKATVQALALNVTDKSIAGIPYKTLLDGRFAHGSPDYQDHENYKVLMGDSTPKEDITRIKEIDETPKVIDGRLTWKYTVSSTSINTDNFGLYYRFIVVDENNNEINGEYSLTKTELTFDVVFTENTELAAAGKTKLSSGPHKLRVYVAPGTEQSQDQIKSFASEAVTVEKLATITQADYKIVSQPDYETLDLSEYFASHSDRNVYLWVSSTGRTYKFGYNEENKLLSKLLIVTNSMFGEFARPDNYEEEYVDYIEISDNASIVNIKFYVEDVNVAIESSNKLTSDESETFQLERMKWPEDCVIEWHDDSGRFTWNYENFSFKRTVTLNEVKVGWELKNSVTVYSASSMLQTDDPITLPAGRIYIKNDPFVDNYVEIYYDEETHASVPESETTRFFEIYGSNGVQNYTEGWFNVTDEEGNELTKEFTEDDVFKIEVDAAENSVISQDGKNYKANKADISYPLFILTASYYDEEDALLEEYNISTYNHYYEPELISAKIKLAIRIKRNENSIQSSEKIYESYANFNLFASGDGTAETPYVILNADQFKNIKHRMTREHTSYVDKDGHEVVIGEGQTYHFDLQDDIVLDEAIDGFLFEGVFDGSINGNGRSITYKSNNVATFKNAVVVASTDTQFHLSNQANSTFTRGSALFETLSATSSVTALNLNVSFEVDGDNSWANWFTTNLLLAGLAIENAGVIDNVNLNSLSTNFGAHGPQGQNVIVAYGGIVGKNYGSGVGTEIKNCTVNAEISFHDEGYGLVLFYGGIAAFNYARITSCHAENKVVLALGNQYSNAQIGGIACSSSATTSNSTIERCTSSFEVEVTTTCQCSGSISGVVVCGRGKVEVQEDDVKDAKLTIPPGYDGIVFNKVNCAGGANG